MRAPCLGAGRLLFSAEALAIIEPFAPPVVSFHSLPPPPELLARVKRMAPSLSPATTVDEGLWLAIGIDAVIAQGWKPAATAAISSIPIRPMALTRQMGTFALDAAAGGRAERAGDRRRRYRRTCAGSVAAALALGAAAVQAGTAHLLCDEATTTPIHRAALAFSEAARHTALTTLFTGRPARGIVNRVMRELGPLNLAAPAFPLATAGDRAPCASGPSARQR